MLNYKSGKSLLANFFSLRGLGTVHLINLKRPIIVYNNELAIRTFI